MRVFISIDLPEEVKKELLRIQKEIDKLGLIKGKFTEPDNFHLTMKFLGNVSEIELRAIKDKLSEIKFDEFHITLSELGVFSENFIRIVWVCFSGEELFNLQKKIDDSLSNLFPKEYRFMAHTTIVRPKFVEDRKVFLDELNKIGTVKKKFLIDKIHLKESKLTNEGAKYSTLMEISPLKIAEVVV